MAQNIESHIPKSRRDSWTIEEKRSNGRKAAAWLKHLSQILEFATRAFGSGANHAMVWKWQRNISRLREQIEQDLSILLKDEQRFARFAGEQDGKDF